MRTPLEIQFVWVFLVPFVLVVIAANVLRLKYRTPLLTTIGYIALYTLISGSISRFMWVALQHVA